MKVSALIAVLSLLATDANAETLRWVCAYSIVASPEGVKREAFKLEFAVDTITRRGVLIGNAGVSDVEVYNGDQGITFLEKLGSGAVQMTAISHKTGRTVHSRHSLLNSNFVPTQYYGECK